MSLCRVSHLLLSYLYSLGVPLLPQAAQLGLGQGEQLQEYRNIRVQGEQLQKYRNIRVQGEQLQEYRNIVVQGEQLQEYRSTG